MGISCTGRFGAVLYHAVPNLKAATKRVRTSLRNAIRNSKVIRSMKSAIKNAEAALLAKDSKAVSLVRDAVSIIDKAYEHGIIHRNKAARKKSRLATRAQLMVAASS